MILVKKHSHGHFKHNDDSRDPIKCQSYKLTNSRQLVHWYLNVYISILILSHVAIIQSVADAVSHVTCGSVVKLSNGHKSKIRLHSHDVKYGSGSGQQSVTGAENQDTNSYWSLLGPKDQQCNRGSPIECGATIRLQHVQTRKFLHSHLFKSPLSNQQEVSAFGSDNESDTGDHWQVHCKTRYWQKSDAARLKHVDTDSWLSLSGNTYGRPIYGQAEVICSTTIDSSSSWTVVEGVYVQPTGTEHAPEHDEL